jgi:hypothetical protein
MADPMFVGVFEYPSDALQKSTHSTLATFTFADPDLSKSLASVLLVIITQPLTT